MVALEIIGLFGMAFLFLLLGMAFLFSFNYILYRLGRGPKYLLILFSKDDIKPVDLFLRWYRHHWFKDGPMLLFFLLWLGAFAFTLVMAFIQYPLELLAVTFGCSVIGAFLYFIHSNLPND